MSHQCCCLCLMVCFHVVIQRTDRTVSLATVMAVNLALVPPNVVVELALVREAAWTHLTLQVVSCVDPNMPGVVSLQPSHVATRGAGVQRPAARNRRRTHLCSNFPSF